MGKSKVAPADDQDTYKLFAMKASFWGRMLIKICVSGFDTAKSFLVLIPPFTAVPSAAWDIIPVKVIGEYFKVKWNVESMVVGGKRIKFSCPFWHFWCEFYKRKARSIGLMCGCVKKDNKGYHESGVSKKKIWAWKEEMMRLKWIDSYIMWADEKREFGKLVRQDINQERFVVMATIPSPVWVKSEQDKLSGCLPWGTQQWKLTNYKVTQTRLDGRGLMFKDPSKKTLSKVFCEKNRNWEDRMDQMLEFGPLPAVMDLTFSNENMLKGGFMPMSQAKKEELSSPKAMVMMTAVLPGDSPMQQQQHPALQPQESANDALIAGL